MRRRAALSVIMAATATAALPGCGLVTVETVDIEPVETPDAEGVLRAAGLPLPDADLTASDGLHVTDLDLWSRRVTFSAEAMTVDAWLEDAFGSSDTLRIGEDGDPGTPYIEPSEVEPGQRTVIGSNSAEPHADFCVLVSLDGETVLVAVSQSAR